MKKLIVFILGIVLFNACITDSVHNHKDSVIVRKDSSFNKLTLRYYSLIEGKYKFTSIFVPECEYELYNINDTIK